MFMQTFKDQKTEVCLVNKAQMVKIVVTFNIFRNHRNQISCAKVVSATFARPLMDFITFSGKTMGCMLDGLYVWLQVCSQKAATGPL